MKFAFQIGLVIGAGASWLLARGASGLLFGVTAGDPQTFVGMIGVLAIVALVGWLPAGPACVAHRPNGAGGSWVWHL